MNLSVGDSINSKNASWNFSGDVPKSFDEHVKKSVPLYNEGHDLILKLSDFFISDNSICYDLGCSTGLLAKKLADRNSSKRAKIIGVDVESDMISFALNGNGKVNGLEFVHADLTELELMRADFIVAFYTIQFIRPSQRQILIDKIYNALNWGGAFILFEKVRGADARFQDITTSLYTDYKLDVGYTPDNIISKSKSLKGILEPFSTQGNLDLLKRAGFVDVMTIMKYVCFEGFLAIK